MIDNLSTIHCVRGGNICGCFYPGFELPAVVPTANRHTLGVLWWEPGHSLGAVGASSDVRTWLFGKSQVPNRPPSRKHCPNFCPSVLYLSFLEWIAAFQLSWKGTGPGTFCGFFALSQLPNGKKDRFWNYFKMLLENPKASSGLNLKMAALLCWVTSSKEISPVWNPTMPLLPP